MILKAGAAIIGAYLVLRGIAEFFLIDLGDASTYRHDWGGPSPAGVLAVHCGPALLIVGYLVARHFTKGTPR